RPPCEWPTALRRRDSPHRRRRAPDPPAYLRRAVRGAVRSCADRVEERRCESVADRDGKRVRGVCGRRFGLQTENCLHHPLHLLLLGAAVTADSLLDTRWRILSARDAGLSPPHQTEP